MKAYFDSMDVWQGNIKTQGSPEAFMCAKTCKYVGAAYALFASSDSYGAIVGATHIALKISLAFVPRK